MLVAPTFPSDFLINAHMWIALYKQLKVSEKVGEIQCKEWEISEGKDILTITKLQEIRCVFQEEKKRGQYCNFCKAEALHLLQN